MKLLPLAALFVAIAFSQNNDCDSLEKCQEVLKSIPRSSLARYRIGEVYFLQGNYQHAAVDGLRESLGGNKEPKWTEVWAHINMGKIFDTTNQRDRALNEYRRAMDTKDNTRGARDEAAKYIEAPYRGN
jgi:tetratricopeptide (TPR) repeat protein